MTNLIDSSIWVALFLDFDSQHEKAERLFKKLKGIAYVPYCVVNEVTTILAYKHSKKQADNFLRYIEHNRDLVLLDESLADEIEFYASLQDRVSFTDAALLFLSQKLKASLVTFDKQLKRIAKRMGENIKQVEL
jgi:predicted nucleic acid-binding protein